MHRTKIVHVTQSLGGVKTYIEHLLNHSDRRKFNYVVIAPANAEFQQLCDGASVKYYTIKSQRNVNVIKDIQAFFRILSILKKEKPDIIHAHSAKGGLVGKVIGKILGLKTVYQPHAFSFLSFTGLKRVAFYLLEYLTKPFTNILLSVSYSEANRAIHEVGYKAKNVKVVLNAIPVNVNLPFKNYTDVKRIGMIGRLTEQKNPLLFLRVANVLLKTYPHLSFSILGAGMTDNLSKEIYDFMLLHDLTDKVEILNWGDNKTSNTFLQNTDVFMLTSVFEGLPYSLVEAMALGIPCVVSKVDGNTDVIHNNENGFACLSDDEFVEKISMLVENQDLRRRLGQAGYRYIKAKHDIQQNVKQLESVYNTLCNNTETLPAEHFDEPANSVPTYRKVSPGI